MVVLKGLFRRVFKNNLRNIFKKLRRRISSKDSQRFESLQFQIASGLALKSLAIWASKLLSSGLPGLGRPAQIR